MDCYSFTSAALLADIQYRSALYNIRDRADLVLNLAVAVEDLCCEPGFIGKKLIGLFHQSPKLLAAGPVRKLLIASSTPIINMTAQIASEHIKAGLLLMALAQRMMEPAMDFVGINSKNPCPTAIDYNDTEHIDMGPSSLEPVATVEAHTEETCNVFQQTCKAPVEELMARSAYTSGCMIEDVTENDDVEIATEFAEEEENQSLEGVADVVSKQRLVPVEALKSYEPETKVSNASYEKPRAQLTTKTMAMFNKLSNLRNCSSSSTVSVTSSMTLSDIYSSRKEAINSIKRVLAMGPGTSMVSPIDDVPPVKLDGISTIQNKSVTESSFANTSDLETSTGFGHLANAQGPYNDDITILAIDDALSKTEAEATPKKELGENQVNLSFGPQPKITQAPSKEPSAASPVFEFKCGGTWATAAGHKDLFRSGSNSPTEVYSNTPGAPNGRRIAKPARRVPLFELRMYDEYMNESAQSSTADNTSSDNDSSPPNGWEVASDIPTITTTGAEDFTSASGEPAIKPRKTHKRAAESVITAKANVPGETPRQAKLRQRRQVKKAAK